MSKSFTLDQLAEGIRERHLGTEGRRLLEKWNRTGLLRGLDGVRKENMARLLENQTAQILTHKPTLPPVIAMRIAFTTLPKPPSG